jgi:uncharacterized protein (DUF2147 family)
MLKIQSAAMATLFVLVGAPAAGASPVGDWIAADGSARVEIARCGEAFCGQPAGDDGRIVFDVHSEGRDRWEGPAFRPLDGQRHDVSLTLAGERTLIMKGCMAVLCVEQVWTRAN